MRRQEAVIFVCLADLRGPSEKQALGFAAELLRRGHRVMMSLGGDPDAALDERSGVLGLALGRHRFIGPRLAASSVRAAREFAPDIIHCFSPRLTAVSAARQYARATGAPVFCHFEDDEFGLLARSPHQSAARTLAKAVARRLAPLHTPLWPFATGHSIAWVREHATALDALTPALALEVTRRLDRPCHVVFPVLANPPDVPGELPAGWPCDGADVVAFTGSVFAAHIEDFRLLLAAIATLQQQSGRDVRLVHAGAVARRFKLLDEAIRLGVAPGTLHPLGMLSQRQLLAVLAHARVLVQPGRPTDFNRLRLPSKLQTYLRSGTPTVTFACGFGELLADDEEVSKTRGSDPRELAAAIARVLEDADLARRLATGGRQAADRLFDVRRNTDALMAYYRGEQGKRPSSPSSGLAPA